MSRRDWIQAELDKNLVRASRAGLAAAKAEPRAAAASYLPARGLLQVLLTNGASLTVPARILPELRGATRARLAEVEVLPGGDGLHWESLDVSISVPGLVASMFGPSAWMAELGRRGGSRASEAKAAAARRNGLRGGRPRAGGVR